MKFNLEPRLRKLEKVSLGSEIARNFLEINRFHPEIKVGSCVVKTKHGFYEVWMKMGQGDGFHEAPIYRSTKEEVDLFKEGVDRVVYAVTKKVD